VDLVLSRAGAVLGKTLLFAPSCTPLLLTLTNASKTTTMLFKMLGMEQASEDLVAQHDGGIHRPRQLFVTQSRVLAEKVQDYYEKLMMSHAAAKRTTEESLKLASKQHERQEQGLVDRDEEEFHHGTLPKQFSELQDDHFPLFLTFDQVGFARNFSVAKPNVFISLVAF
jgi:hypothetical protein